MCDAGWDGDMYNPTTSSGKWVGQGYKRYGNGDIYWKPAPLILLDPQPQKIGFKNRLVKATKALFNKDI